MGALISLSIILFEMQKYNIILCFSSGEISIISASSILITDRNAFLSIFFFHLLLLSLRFVDYDEFNSTILVLGCLRMRKKSKCLVFISLLMEWFFMAIFRLSELTLIDNFRP